MCLQLNGLPLIVPLAMRLDLHRRPTSRSSWPNSVLQSIRGAGQGLFRLDADPQHLTISPFKQMIGIMAERLPTRSGICVSFRAFAYAETRFLTNSSSSASVRGNGARDGARASRSVRTRTRQPSRGVSEPRVPHVDPGSGLPGHRERARGAAPARIDRRDDLGRLARGRTVKTLNRRDFNRLK